MIISEIIKEHMKCRSQIFKLAKADLVKTYRGSALGWLWAIIKPTVTIFVYWFAITIGLRNSDPVNGYPSFLWMIAGIVPWFYMSEMITQGTDSIRKYSYLVTKMDFPVSTIPTFVSISKLLVNMVLLLIVILIFAVMGYAPDIYLLQLPFYLILMFVFFTLFSLCSALLSSMSKDFSNFVKSFVTAIFWLSGILWNVDKLKNPWLTKVLRFNPVTFLTSGFRNVFIEKIWFFEQPKRLIYFLVILCIMFVLAMLSYKKLRKEIPDVL